MGLEFTTNPFGIPSNGNETNAYVTPVTAISSVLVENLPSIFSYKSFSEPDLLDGAIKSWVQKSNKEVQFEELQLRSGAGLTPLGFAKGNGKGLLSGIITPGYGLSYFANSFKHENGNENRFLLNVGALNYDDNAGQITNDFVTPLKVAANLLFPVVSPVSTSEVKQTTLLAIALAKFGKQLAAVNLFDAANYAKTVLHVDEQESKDIIEKISKSLVVNSSFDQILDKFNELSPRKLHNFEYYGDEEAETVFVTFGCTESELFNAALKDVSSKVGSIAIRIPLPFDVEKFVSQIPKTAKNVVVIGQSLDGQSPTTLKSQVSAALFSQRVTRVKLSEYLYQPDFVWSQNAVEQVISSFVPDFKAASKQDAENFIYWASDSSVNIDVASRLVHALSLVDGREVALRTKFDNYAKGGVFQAQFLSKKQRSSAILSNIDAADVTVVENMSVLNSFDVASKCKENGVILVIGEKTLKDKKLSDAKVLVDDLKLPAGFLKQVVEKGIQLVFLDTETIGDREETKGRTISFVIQAAFWKYAYNLSIAESVRRIWSSAGSDIELLAAVLSETITTAFEVALLEVSSEELKKSFTEITSSEDGDFSLPSLLAETSFKPNPRELVEHPEVETSSISEISKHITFKEAFATQNSLRPDLPVKNFVVKVKENRRVTPADYDRYIFHIEFDITGTGLTYGIGEALGVHARNNIALVKEFLESYGLRENDIIQVPNKENHQILESRTVLQACLLYTSRCV